MYIAHLKIIKSCLTMDVAWGVHTPEGMLGFLWSGVYVHLRMWWSVCGVYVHLKSKITGFICIEV